MTTSILRTLIPLSLIAFLGTVPAMADDSAHFTIPFDFTVGKQQLYAGEYQVGRAAPSVLLIRRADGGAAVMTMANAASPSQVAGIVTLTFDKIDNRYFLTQWSGNSSGLELRKPDVEKELIARRLSRKPITVVASSLK